MFYAIFGDGRPISFTLSLTHWLTHSLTHSLTDSEVAIYFEMGVGFADLSIYIFVYVLKEYF
jgi:hypothetical protein